jgi:hypothetical protein
MSERGRKAVQVIQSIVDAAPVKPADTDKENVFMLYATFCGDVERTAHAAGITPVEVINLAEAEGWNVKLRSIFELKKSGRSGDVERAINRALNFVQAHKLRCFLERVVQRIAAMPQEEVDDLLISYRTLKDGGIGKQFSTRPLADLAAALEKCHVLTYLSLNDSTTERRARDDAPDKDVSGGELHAQIAAAMAQTRTVVSELKSAQAEKEPE